MAWGNLIPRPGIEPMSPVLAGRFLTTEVDFYNSSLLWNGKKMLHRITLELNEIMYNVWCKVTAYKYYLLLYFKVCGKMQFLCCVFFFFFWLIHVCINNRKHRLLNRGFPGGISGKEPTCQCRRHKRHRFSPWVGKVPWRRKWQPTPVFLPGESHGQKNLVDYSPYSHTELDVTEVT